MRRKLILWLGLLIILCMPVFPGAAAVGVSPVSATVEYVQGLDVQIPYTVRGNSPSRSTIIISVSAGPLSDYATVDKEILEVPSGLTETFNLNLKIPPEHGLIGPQVLTIGVTEQVADESEGMIIVTTGVDVNVKVMFPYPGKYLDITEYRIPNINEGQNTNYKIGVKNRGSETVTFDSILSVTNSQGEQVWSRVFNPSTLNPEEQAEESGPLESSKFAPGPYSANYSISYAGETKSAALTFFVGEENIELVEMSPHNLTAGEINPVTLKVKNLWNSGFSQVYATITFMNASTTTPSIPLGPLQEATISHFLQVPVAEEGVRTAQVTLHFAGKSTSDSWDFYVVTKEEPKRPTNFATIAVISIGVLLLALIIMLLIVFRKRKK